MAALALHWCRYSNLQRRRARVGCWLEENPQFLPQFIGLFEADAAGDLRIAISCITLAEVLTGPLRQGQDALAQRYERALTDHYLVLPVSNAIAALAARMRARYGLKLPDAIQLATALDLEAAALVTHDRDFSRVEGLRIVTGDGTAA